MIGTFMQDMAKKPMLSVDELDNLAAILGFQFVQRWDLYAQQLDNGRYVCVRKPLRNEHLTAHLSGKLTLGMYMMNAESQSRHIVFDADDKPGWRRLKALAGVLDEIGTTAYLEFSRRGGHLWLFFEEPIAGENARQFGQGLMLYFSLGSLELFPKQSQLSGGPGSLVRMPFGVHRKSGMRYGFYVAAEGKPLAPTLREQICLLETPQTVSQEVVERFRAHAPRARPRVRLRRKTEGNSGLQGKKAPLYEQVKSAMPLRDFVSQYVSLSPSGKGLCPFHNDHVESFSVTDKNNYWHCFACEAGGSIIDFWMCYRECEFKDAVEELADMLF